MKIFNDEYLSTARINTLPFRAYYIPFAKDDKVKRYKGAILKSSSSKYISLNGNWNFKEYRDFKQFNNLDYKFSDNEIIDVPSCVQCRGYDSIQYLNLLYPFPFNPPYIDIDNPLFHYQRHFYINKKDRYYLNFEGVDNAFYVFINNKKVGYSNIAHSTSEFDITEYLVDGDNKIDVLVLKWSASSYFEDQDKFRFSGIFRDVYILNRKKEHIEDYFYKTKLIKNRAYLIFENRSSIPLTLRLKSKSYIVKENKKISIKIDNPILWTSYNPYLYSLKIESDDEIIYERFGIRNVSTSGGVFKINNEHIKLKGVNRHESNPYNGMSVTLSDTYRDLKLMKELGINAIRTSHYPDIPEFYEMCDYLGFYVLDEADLETHGADFYTGKFDHDLWTKFANEQKYEETIYQREVSLFERDKNRTSVIIFSLGNESCFGKSFYKGLTYLKKNSDRPIHYEGAYNSTNKDDYYNPMLDFASRMYASPQELVKKHLKDKREKRPIILCEYSHAMGNSNGDLRDYWKVINSSKRFAGGFVWEWCDHAVMVNGKLHYGGDSNDLPNDKNFCVDGLVTPFRKLKSNTLELSAIYHDKYEEDEKVNIIKRLKAPKNNKKVVVSYDENRAKIRDVFVDGNKVFSDGISLSFKRAYLDNDINEKTSSFRIIEQSKTIIDEVQTLPNGMHFKGHLFNKINIFDFDVYYRIIKNCLSVKFSYQINKEKLHFPRIGIEFKLAKKGKQFIYFGYGPFESYIDKHIHNKMGHYFLNIRDNLGNNLKPQESGSHYYSSYLNVDDVFVTASKPFSFSVLPFSTEELINAKHKYDLKNKNDVYVHLDIAMAGVGSNSCGPSLDEKYWPKKKDSNTFKIYFE